MSGSARCGTRQPHYTTTGVLFIVVLVLVAAFVAFQFRGKFTKTVDVALLAQRSGLNLEPGTRVKLLDVQVGRIGEVEEVDGYAKIHLDLFPEQAGSIPANVDATIDSTTVFGAKYVNLRLPKEPSAQSISSGDTIDTRHITPELNTLFERLTTVLRAVSPEDLNATLAAVSDAFRGRGEQVGRTLENADSYLNALRPSLDNLQRDAVVTAEVANLYADVAPSFLTSVESLTTTGSTVVEKADDLDRVLLAAIDFGQSASQVLNDNQTMIAEVLANLVPTTQLLDKYSPEFACFFQGLDEARAVVEGAVGGTVPGLNISGTVLAGDMPYSYPRDVPVVAASGGPRCGRLPSVNTVDGPAPYVVTDTGVNPFAPNNRPAQLNVLDFLLYGVPGGL
ncbi:phospholipid/cholesterol/gamma-HCH transport system substrate-binding protein [Rhodococcus erythropolis]|uniref:MCE family protein n=1 Tax=Rhodococcus erythropolis TaxID=1833 RepID=UPI00216A1FC1|nr:MCE family protein [Rhodococcus erythropolis]MCS4257868.1 phospholipid/cholesterol/gamma-HCH transport system substrate-binding protein [Rhodococcus erythropolis]MCW2425173.1 phospholipid/cholesterol/gamma-HCH transport system substrate-binding protein [Rhodococcus erythropolis]